MAEAASASPDVVDVDGTKVLFLNAHLFKGTAMARVYGAITHRDEQRADAIAERISESGASVAMLAEVWGASSRDRIVRGAAPTHPHVWAPPPPAKRAPLRLGTGLLFLSTAPIEKTAVTHFRDLNSWDAWSQKGVASARVGGVAYVATHLDAEGAARDRECRASNMRQVVAHIAEHVGGNDAPCVFAGDMNTHDACDEFPPMQAAFASLGMRDAFRTLHPADPGVTMDHALNGLAALWSGPKDTSRTRLDYFFVRGVTPIECSVGNGFCPAGFASSSSRRFGGGGGGRVRRLATVVTPPPQPVQPMHPNADPAAAAASAAAKLVEPPLPLSDHWPLQLTFLKS